MSIYVVSIRFPKIADLQEVSANCSKEAIIILAFVTHEKELC